MIDLRATSDYLDLTDREGVRPVLMIWEGL